MQFSVEIFQKMTTQTLDTVLIRNWALILKTWVEPEGWLSDEVL